MRYQRLFGGDVCLATGIGSGQPAEVSFALVCPKCGNRWGRLEGTDLSIWNFVRHECGCATSRPVAIAPDKLRGLAGIYLIPGSFLFTPVHFFQEADWSRLLLEHPKLCKYEQSVHSLLQTL